MSDISVFLNFVLFCHAMDPKVIALTEFTDAEKIRQKMGTEFEPELKLIEEEANKRFPVLVLVDLVGTLLARKKI